MPKPKAWNPGQRPNRHERVVAETPYKQLARRKRTAERAQADLGEVVYYARHKGAIKIGYSVNVVQRMRHLGVPIADLLAVEPGGYSEEQAAHARFAEHHLHGEYFRLGPELLAHINGIRASVGAARVE